MLQYPLVILQAQFLVLVQILLQVEALLVFLNHPVVLLGQLEDVGVDLAALPLQVQDRVVRAVPLVVVPPRVAYVVHLLAPPPRAPAAPPSVILLGAVRIPAGRPQVIEAPPQLLEVEGVLPGQALAEQVVGRGLGEAQVLRHLVDLQRAVELPRRGVRLAVPRGAPRQPLSGPQGREVAPGGHLPALLLVDYLLALLQDPVYLGSVLLAAQVGPGAAEARPRLRGRFVVQPGELLPLATALHIAVERLRLAATLALPLTLPPLAGGLALGLGRYRVATATGFPCGRGSMPTRLPRRGCRVVVLCGGGQGGAQGGLLAALERYEGREFGL